MSGICQLMRCPEFLDNGSNVESGSERDFPVNEHKFENGEWGQRRCQ